MRAIFRALDASGDGEITFDELLQGAQRMHRAFHGGSDVSVDGLMDLGHA